jgi:hypothetical protein
MGESFQKNCQQSWIKLSMHKQNLRVMTPIEFDFLETRKWNGVYNKRAREELYSIIEKLNCKKRNCSRAEKKIYQIFQKANFGIHGGEKYANSGYNYAHR